MHIIGSSTNGIGDNASTVDICVMAHKKLAQPSSEQPPVNDGENKGEDNKEKDKTDKKEEEKPIEEKVEEEKVVKAVADSNTDGDVVSNEKEKDNANVMANEDLELKHI